LSFAGLPELPFYIERHSNSVAKAIGAHGSRVHQHPEAQHDHHQRIGYQSESILQEGINVAGESQVARFFL
jgi:hypothetical protein